jgi:hypothetical protein
MSNPTPSSPTFKATLSLPADTTIACIPVKELKPGDVIILQSPKPMTQKDMLFLRDETKKLFPEQRIVLYANGITLSVLRDPESSEY